MLLDKTIKIFCLIALISANVLLLGISYKLDVCIDRLSKIEFTNDVSLYK